MTEKKNMRVSIITVSLNAVKTIEQTILSVLNQSYEDIEYIIVDGMSTDGTVDIIQKYENRLGCFIHEKDTGLYDAMNKGIARASGDIVGIINSDDWYDDNAIEKVAACFRETDAEVVYGRMRILEDGKVGGVSPREELGQIWTRGLSHPAVFIKRSVYGEYGCFDTKYRLVADYDFLLKIYTGGVKFVYIDMILANFRLGGLSSVRDVQVSEEALDVVRHYIGKCPEKEEVLCLRAEMVRTAKWNYLLDVVPDKMCEWLREKYPNALEGVAVWGSGFWGGRTEHALERGGLEVPMFIDSDRKVWGKTKNNLLIEPPEKLKDFRGLVVIAIRHGAEEVCGRLRELNESGIQWISLEEISREYKA